MEYLGSTQNNPKQLEGLNVEYLGSTTTAKTSCCGQQQRTMLSLGQQQRTTLSCRQQERTTLSCRQQQRTTLSRRQQPAQHNNERCCLLSTTTTKFEQPTIFFDEDTLT